MPQRTHKTAAVLTPPIEHWPPIQQIRTTHDRHTRRWMPHITLIYPFVPRASLTLLAIAFQQRLRDHVPFEITLGRFDTFHHGRERFTLYLAPEPAEPLVHLQDALQTIVPDLDEVRRHEAGFTPHLSVGQVTGRARLHQLLQTLRASWTPLTFTVREVSLIARGVPPHDVFEVVQRIPLAGQRA
jgi:2'-5' RNA ligase